MKFNKRKNKGKVHPSPSSSSSTTNKENPVSSLNHLLPATILTLISVLSLQDREVLAYMITHSLKSSTLNYASSSNLQINPKKKPTKKSSPSSSSSTTSHTSPSFDCDCFNCYTTFWFRWDSSPHRELIHQAIEAFEEHLSSTEKTKIKSLKEKASADVEERDSSGSHSPDNFIVVTGDNVEERDSSGSHSPDNFIVVTEDDVEERETQVIAGEEVERESATQEKQIHQQQQRHKGLARKVLPDFIGFFQSRLWNRLWRPNV
ncbi:uncharacterized protein LOC130821302 [Amaranthus tricolor]|uniref:uncharacterized protein LOC130821302 n=1 Tax=Amaranthus tricolor TaxID=29722 RepID=UPI00258A8995|nr:uncharacterized protein LOC130821302 [Amaranthus tricolor]